MPRLHVLPTNTAAGCALLQCRTVGQIPQKCKETLNLMWLSLICFILVLFICWNLFWTSESNVWLKPKMFLFCFPKILTQAFLHDSHTFDSEVSLRSWLRWPTVGRVGRPASRLLNLAADYGKHETSKFHRLFSREECWLIRGIRTTCFSCSDATKD